MRFKELKNLRSKHDKGVECSFSERFTSLRIIGVLMACCISLPFWAGCTTVNVMGRKRPLLQYEPVQGEVELSVQVQEDKQKGGQTQRKSTVSVFEERLRLRTTGDIYHSRLLFFDIAIGLGLAQQDLSSDEESKKTNASLEEYALSFELFGEKPYPISFYTSRSENLVSRQFLGPITNESESSGISLGLRSEEFPMRFQYTESESTQNSLSSITPSSDFFRRSEKRFEYSVSHDFSELSHLGFDFDETIVTNETTNSEASSTTDRYSLIHNLIFGKDEQNRLGSFFTLLDQSGQSVSESFQWGERLALQHTDNFSTNYDFRFSDSKQEFTRSKTKRSRAAFRHKLYDSLTTSGHVFMNNTDSGESSNTDRKGGGLNFSYTKKNPWGVLSGGYSASLTMTERTGSGGIEPVENEPHTVPDDLFIRVQLDRTGIISSSIEVKDIDQLTLFQEDDDYRIIETGGRTFLEIFIPPRGAQQVPNFTDGQDFFVDYDFVVEPEQKEDILRQRFRIRQKFNNGVSLYYAMQKQEEDLSSTDTELIPDESRSDTYGATYNIGNLNLLAEYNKVESTSLPSNTKLLEGSYSWDLSNTTSAMLRIKNEWNNFGEPDSRDLETFEIGGQVSSKLTERSSIDFDIDYFDEKDSRFGPTKGLHFDISLLYNYRQMSLTSGLEFDLLERENDEDTSTFWYIRMKRFF